jgi:hypothetical protein
MKYFYVAAMCAGLTACGGGSSDGGSDPVTQPTTPSAEVTGTIQYTQYQATNTPMGDKAFATTTLSASAAFNASSKEGSIQFPVLNGSEVVSTKDGGITTCLQFSAELKIPKNRKAHPGRPAWPGCLPAAIAMQAPACARAFFCSSW